MVSGRILCWYGKTWALAASVSTLLALLGFGTALVKLLRGLVQAVSYLGCTLQRAILTILCELGATVECGKVETLKCSDVPGGMQYFLSWSGLLLTSLLVCAARVVQLVVHPGEGRSFAEMEYYRLLCCYCFLVLLDILRVIYWTNIEVNMFERITTYASPIHNFVLCALEICFRDRFRQYMRDMMVTQAADYFVTADPVSQISANTGPRIFPRLRRILSWFMRPQIVYISLPDDQGLEMGTSLAGSTGPLCLSSNRPEFTENIIHWSRMFSASHTGRSLWITARKKEHHAELACKIYESLSSTDGDSKHETSLVDVSRTDTVFWPLIQALVAASPEYRAEIGRDPPVPFADYFRSFPVRPTAFGDGGGWEVSPWPDGEWDSREFINQLLGVPLETVLTRRKLASRRGGEETIVPPELRRITLIIHGVRNVEQAYPLYETIERLKDFYPWIGVVVITEPQVLRNLSHSPRVIMENVCTMYVPHGSDAGSIIYSGRHPSPPMFYEGLFLPLLDDIHCGGDHGPQSALADVALLFDEPSDSNTYADDTTSFTAPIFSHLYKMSLVRQQILELLYKFQVMSHTQINWRLVKDNPKIAKMLQRLFERNSYKTDIPFLPREHVLAVMNLTSHITQYGVSINPNANDLEAQSNIWHFLSWLSAYMDQLPADAVVNGVVLLSDHPVKHGGFSDVYHGRYQDPDGRPVEVALKVLKIFEHQTDRNHRALHERFMREALVWHSLNHPNVVPLIGIDSTTFPSPSRALVSLWMPLGSVLTYMRENSPSSSYAGDLLNDVIRGLTYLHDLDIVHGDLCGRNILINEDGRGCLSDFGLAGFIQLDHSIKSPARGGSTRWMAPELIAPTPDHPFRRTRESDVWAFGCVCCEIWSEGKIPFSHILTDMGIVLAISESAKILSQERPYATRPHDKGGNLMPDSLWNLAQWCFQYEPSERPDVHMMAGIIGGIEPHSVQHVSGSVVVSGAGGSVHTTPQSPTALSVEDLIVQEFTPSGSYAGPSQMGTPVIRFDEDCGTVLFGPMKAENPEALFIPLFHDLSHCVPKGALVEPLSVEMENDHFLLRFRTLLEANSFAMTWMVYRFDPYLQVTAAVVEHEW